MTAYKLFLASVLLSAPPDSLSLSDGAILQADLAPYLRFIALQWQILEPRDARGTLASRETFLAELKSLQTANRDLMNAPWLDECGRFPQKQAVSEFILANRIYRSEINDRLALDRVHHNELQGVMTDIEDLFCAWDTLRDALSEHYGITVRRQALQKLRELIGAEAFYRGEMPPALPIWRFARQ